MVIRGAAVHTKHHFQSFISCDPNTENSVTPIRQLNDYTEYSAKKKVYKFCILQNVIEKDRKYIQLLYKKR